MWVRGVSCDCPPYTPDPLTLDAYQERAARYDIAAPTRGRFWYYGLGVAGEAGEVADKIKKLYRDGHMDTISDVDKVELTKELGDVLWYVAAVARMLGVSLGQVADANIEKLEDRLRRGVMFGSGDVR
jgi:NTP pyrophosphatase (non-canonical NTP hydrolase)